MLRFIESFDHYTTNAQLALKWNVAGANIVPSASWVRTGTYGVYCNVGSIQTFAKTIDDQRTWIIGAAHKASSIAAHTMLELLDSAAAVQIRVVMTAGGNIAVYRGASATLLGTSTFAAVAGTYFYMELKVYIDNSAGTVDLHINGSATGGISLTDQDTQASATLNTAQVIRFSAYNLFGWDDIYICDGAGGYNDDFLGDVKVECILPTGDGATHTFTPSTGSDHYALVDEVPPNTTDYNHSATVDQKDTLTFPDLATASGVVCGIQHNIYAIKTDAGTRTICPVVRSSGADYDGSTVALATAYNYYREIVEKDPADSAAWDVTRVNAAEFGYKLVA